MAIPLRVLILEDRAADAELMVHELRRGGFEPVWERVETEAEYLSSLDPALDVILADYSLPQFDALRALQLLQERALDIPFIIVSGTIGEDVAVAAMREGAADYLLKDRLARLGPAVLHALERRRFRQEQRRMHEALRESEERYRSLFENMPIGLYRTTPEGRILYLNPALVQILGCPNRKSALTWNVADLYVNPEDRRQELALLQRDGAVRGFEVQLRRQDGTIIWVEDTAQAVKRADGRVRYYEGGLKDITERKRAEEERSRLLVQIQEQAKQVQQIIDTVPEGVLLLDAEERVIIANPLGREDLTALAGADVGDTLSHLGCRPLAELLTSPPKGLWHEVTVEGPPQRYFEILARPVESSSQGERRVLVILDVTEERQVQKRVQQQERLAAIGQLAGGIAHDFNNLLATISLYSQMLLHGPNISSSMTRGLETIIDETRQATKLVRQILDFSRSLPIETHPVDLQAFIEGSVRILERTIPENIHISANMGAEKCVVNADSTRIQQVVMNLVVNARDAMLEGGELEIRLAAIKVKPGEAPPVVEMAPAWAPGSEWVCLSVSDTGTGIPTEVIPHIFEPFFTTKASGKGTGLGLAQVYGIVKQHGGHIGVETEVGRGTTFRVYLPAFQGQVIGKIGVEEKGAAPEGKKETILLVEDKEATRHATARILGSLGYRVLTAANGMEALVVYRAVAGIDLVVTDIVMPEMGGTQLIQELRKINRDIKALAITGSVLAENLGDLHEEGGVEIIHKPLDMNALAEVVRHALNGE